MSFFDELKRRNVFRVAIGYAITAWLLLQVVDLVLGLRVSEEEEREGLDISSHGETAYHR